MPERFWDMLRPRNVALSGEEIVLGREGLRLRPRDPETGLYRPGAPLSAGEARLGGHPASALRSLYGLRADLDENGGAVGWRLSTDGGATWTWFNGGAWVEVLGGSEWNSVETVDAELPGLDPAPKRDLALRIRLVPAPDGRNAPVLRRVALYLDYEVVNFPEDLLRSVKRFLEGAGPSEGAPPVFIAADVDYQLSEIPSVLLQMPGLRELRRLRSGDFKLDWALARGLVRERAQPHWFAADLLVSCQSEKKREALAMADRVLRAFERSPFIPSLATGEEFRAIDLASLETRDSIPRGLYVSQVNVTIEGVAWMGEAEEKRIAEELAFAVNVGGRFREERR